MALSNVVVFVGSVGVMNAAVLRCCCGGVGSSKSMKHYIRSIIDTYRQQRDISSCTIISNVNDLERARSSIEFAISYSFRTRAARGVGR